MVKRNKGVEPRAPHGGHSARYEERREARGSVRQYAGAWTDAAACALLEGLHKDSQQSGVKITANTRELLLNPGRMGALITRTAAKSGMSKADESLAREQVAFYSGGVSRAMASGGEKAANKRVRAFLKPLRDRRVAEGDLSELVVEPLGGEMAGLASLLSLAPEKEFGRGIEKNNRILDGLADWYPRWLKVPGVVCYEHAAGRVWNERRKHGGPVGPLFASRLVRTHTLPTLTANGGNHYVVVIPGKQPRFMTVPEVCRSCMLPAQSRLWAALNSGVVTANRGGASRDRVGEAGRRALGATRDRRRGHVQSSTHPRPGAQVDVLVALAADGEEGGRPTRGGLVEPARHARRCVEAAGEAALLSRARARRARRRGRGRRRRSARRSRRRRRRGRRPCSRMGQR
jgi:hypothetical protein